MALASNSTLARDFVKFTSLTDGRDKIYRTAQYVSRWLIWYSENGGETSSSDLMIRIKNLEAAVTLSRKLFRMARSMEFLQKASDAMNITDDILKTFEVLGMLGKAIWLVSDHVIWFGKVKVIEVDLGWWSRISAWTWLLGIVSLILRDLRKIQNIALRAKAMKDGGDREDPLTLKMEYKAARVELIKNFCDMWIPLGSLGYANKGYGASGGVISSLIGFRQLWHKTVKK
ncbi:uncharacterized protein LOC144447868 [Glandiceps talaboti]